MIEFDSVFNSVRISEIMGFMSVPLGSNYGNTLIYVVWIPESDTDTLINTNEILYKGKVSIEFGQLITEGIFNSADFIFTIDVDSTFYPIYKVLPDPGLSKNLPLGTSTNLDNVTVSVFSEGGYGAFIESDIINPFINADLSLINEGYYDPLTDKLNLTDSITVYLRNAFSPFQIIDAAKSLLDSESLKCNLNFTSAADGIYYLDVRHRNSLQTWSKTGGESFHRGSTVNYTFTDLQSKAYGNNLTLKGTKWCLFSGDVNQNGLIDLSDVLLVYNDANSFLRGYIVTDVTGDSIVDLSDIVITFNNSNNFVSVIKP